KYFIEILRLRQDDRREQKLLSSVWLSRTLSDRERWFGYWRAIGCSWDGRVTGRSRRERGMTSFLRSQPAMTIRERKKTDSGKSEVRLLRRSVGMVFGQT